MADLTTTERLGKIVAELVNVSPEAAMLPGAAFIDDLGFDGLDYLDMCGSIEDEWDIEISDEDLADVLTVSDAIALIDRLVADQHRPVTGAPA